MIPVIAVMNRKGGVGKTTLTKDLSYEFVRLGLRTLNIELDPQSSLAVIAGLGLFTPPDRTASRLLLPEEFTDTALDAVFHDAPWEATLIPAGSSLAVAERALSDTARGGANKRLSRGLERIQADSLFDVVLIDCPPGMTALTMNALVAANFLLVPTPLDYLSIAGLALLTQTVDEVKEYDNPDLEYLGIVGTQVDSRTRHSREVRAQLEELFGAQSDGSLSTTMIRHTIKAKDANAAHLAIGQYDPSSGIAEDYRQLAKELVTRANLVPKSEMSL